MDVITNPPFRETINFVLTAKRLLRKQGKLALLLPTRYLNGQRRKKKVFDIWPRYQASYFASGLFSRLRWRTFSRKSIPPYCRAEMRLRPT